MELIIKITAFAFLGSFGALLIKKHTQELSFLLSLGAGLIILFIILSLTPSLSGIWREMRQYIPDADGVMEPMGKAALICVVTRLSAETCRDCEQRALAAKVELAGTVICFVSSAPLFERVLSDIGAML